MHNVPSPSWSNRSVAHILTTKPTTLPPLREAPECCPAEQPEGAKDETPNNNFIFVTVALEALREHIVLGRILAKGNTLL